MSETEMERRLTVLEQEISVLKAKVNTELNERGLGDGVEPTKLPWWHSHVGIFADDPAHEEAMRLGREWRESQREDYDEA